MLIDSKKKQIYWGIVLAQHKGEVLLKTRLRGLERNLFKVKPTFTLTNFYRFQLLRAETPSINRDNAGDLVLFTFYFCLQF